MAVSGDLEPPSGPLLRHVAGTPAGAIACRRAVRRSWEGIARRAVFGLVAVLPLAAVLLAPPEIVQPVTIATTVCASVLALLRLSSRPAGELRLMSSAPRLRRPVR